MIRWNPKRKIILVVYALAFVFLSVAYVPFAADTENLHLQYYRPLWSPRHPKTIDYWAEDVEGAGPKSVWLVKFNAHIWALEISTLSVVFGVLFILTGKQGKGIR